MNYCFLINSCQWKNYKTNLRSTLMQIKSEIWQNSIFLCQSLSCLFSHWNKSCVCVCVRVRACVCIRENQDGWLSESLQCWEGACKIICFVFVCECVWECACECSCVWTVCFPTPKTPWAQPCHRSMVNFPSIDSEEEEKKKETHKRLFLPLTYTQIKRS